MDLAILLPLLKLTSGVALSCTNFNRKVSSNAFPIRTSKGGLCLENLSFYRLLNYPWIDEWLREEMFGAINDNKVDYIQLLMESGADLESKDRWGCTALLEAARAGKIDCLRLLLQCEANIAAEDSGGNTVLISAAVFGRTDCLKLLLERGADIEATDNLERTALMWTAWYGHTDCVRVLLQHGAEISPGLRKKYPQYSDLW